MTIGHYLRSMKKLTEQWTPANYRDTRRQRLYLKDIDCPEAWYQHLETVMPQILFYLNDGVGEIGGPGALHERNINNQLAPGKGIAPAGDLMSSLPPPMRAENMMCYIGHEGTYTPAHREMCATLGQNIMVESSDPPEGEKPGSSIWFMTESKDREVVSEYFLSMLGHDIEVESHFAQINAWKKAPFPVYIVEQKVGDMILIPPLAPHQVWNRGARTMKVAWNRTTVETLELAIHEALPRARMVCRDEQYKCKAIIYYTLLKYYDLLKRLERVVGESRYFTNEPIRNAPRIRQLQKDFKRLFQLYTEVLISETFSSELPKEKNIEFLPYDSNVTCSYCRCNIFNRFLTCKTCINTDEETDEEDTYDICMECYAMGRSCSCISNLNWVEQWHWSVLSYRYDEWRSMILAMDGFIDMESSPQPLDVARERYGKKPVAEICQEQLRKRPWRDVSKPIVLDPLPGDSDNEPEVDDEGRLKKKKVSRAQRRKSQQNKHGLASCHVCKHEEWNWKLAFCTTCPKAYCYGSLWRAFDFKPQTIMEDRNWKCPKCLNICSCGACRRDPSQHPYQPKGTLLGHDTRRIADPRSVESLVDFGRTNLSWLRGVGDDDPQSSLRMQKLMQKAQAEKERVEALEESVEEDKQQADRLIDPGDTVAIDPMLYSNAADFPLEANLESNNFLPNSMNDTSVQSTVPDAAYQANAAHQNIEDFNIVSTLQMNNYKDNPYSGSSFNGGYVTPAAVMNSSYPDPSSLGRDKMVGMGYYQQASEVDKILFDHPDFNVPTGQNSCFVYPNLAQEHEEHQPTRKKRKTDGHKTTGHDQLSTVQKRQRLAKAKKRGFYFMTQNKLNGGTPLIVKLCLTNSKDFLEQLEVDKPTHVSPNSERTHTSLNPQRLSSESSEDLIIIESDVQDKVNHNSYHRRENRATHAKPAKTTLSKPVPSLNSDEKSSLLGNVLVHERPQSKKAGPFLNVDNKHSSGSFQETHEASGKRERGRQPKRRPSEALAMATSPSEGGMRPQTFKPTTNFLEPEQLQFGGPVDTVTFDKVTFDGTNSEEEALLQAEIKKVKHKSVAKGGVESSFQKDPKKVINDRSNTSFKKAEHKVISDHPSGTDEYINDITVEVVTEDMTQDNSVLVKQKVDKPTSFSKDPTTGASLIQHKRTAKPRTSVRLSSFPIDDPATPTPSSIDEDLDNTSTASDFLSDDEEEVIPVDENYNPIPTSASTSNEYEIAKLEALRMVEAELEGPEQSSAFSTAKNAMTGVIKPLPKAPLGKFMSMAERRSFQDKPFKIVGAKPTPNTTSQVSSEVNIGKPQATIHPDLGRCSIAESSSSRDDIITATPSSMPRTTSRSSHKPDVKDSDGTGGASGLRGKGVFAG